MKIQFLGTGAADWPVTRWENMTEFRRMSSAVIDDVLLIDPGPQAIEALLTYGKKPKEIKYIINTHGHGDYRVFLLFSRSVMSNSLQLHGLQHIVLPCPSPSPRSCSNSYPLSQ